ncbi:MAG TPA: hypothetical protein VGZ22_19710 [Isosphaeraceae bacterium]|nr:hypothetical protein [Isosphaeraceae bacterium]
MTRPRKLWRWLWFALLTLLAVGLVIRAWVIPTLIVRQIEGRYEGRATIRDWWLNSHSAGLVGLVLYEDRSARSPIWVQADQIEADLSLGQVLRGDVMPRRVVVREPRLAFRIDRNGALLTLPRFKSSGPTNAPLPDVVIEDAQLVFRQEDRPEMVVSKVDAELTPEPGGRGGVRITAKADDPIRGHFDASGALGSSFRTGTFELVGKRVAASPSSVTSIPFVSESVWKYVLPTGPVDVRLSIELTGDTQQPARIHTVVGFQHTTVEMPSLGLISLDSVGVLTVNGGVVKLDHIHGRILDGPVVLTGLFDFSRSPSRIDLGVDLERVDVSHTPPGWQLGILDATGRLTGHAHLVVALVDSGPDFTRSWGWGDVAEATLQGTDSRKTDQIS